MSKTALRTSIVVAKNTPIQLIKLRFSPTKKIPSNVAKTPSRLSRSAAFEASTFLCPRSCKKKAPKFTAQPKNTRYLIAGKGGKHDE